MQLNNIGLCSSLVVDFDLLALNPFIGAYIGKRSICLIRAYCACIMRLARAHAVTCATCLVGSLEQLLGSEAGVGKGSARATILAPLALQLVGNTLQLGKILS
jgi:hypothetical protein